MVWEDEICNNYTKIYNLLKIERCGVKGPLSVPVHFDGAHSALSGSGVTRAKRPRFKLCDGPNLYFPVLHISPQGSFTQKLGGYYGRSCILEFARTSLFTPMVVAVLTVLPEDVFNEFCCSELSICTQIEEGLRLSAYEAHLEFVGFGFWV